MITEWSIKKTDGLGEIRISVIRSARKSLGLEVRDANTVLARIPTRVSDPRFRPGAEGLCGKSPKLDPGENSGHGRA